jgi:hypothetical protein
MENPSTWSPLASAINNFDPEELLLNRLIAKGFLPYQPYNDMLGAVRSAYVEHRSDFERGACGYSIGRRVEIKLQELLGAKLDYYIP